MFIFSMIILNHKNLYKIILDWRIMKFESQENPEFIKLMQSFKGRLFTRKDWIPIYSLEFKISDEEFSNFVDKIKETADRKLPSDSIGLSRLTERIGIDEAKEMINQYNLLSNFPKYWVVTKLKEKNNFLSVNTLLNKNSLLTKIYYSIPKRDVLISLKDSIYYNRGYCYDCFEEKGIDGTINLTFNKITFLNFK